MAARAGQDMSIEQFDAWCAARRDCRETHEAADEEGGPRVTLVPDPISVPLDFLPDEVELVPLASPLATTPQLHAIPFDPAPSRKVGGWSAMRQMLFIETLAETGSVHMAAKSAGLSARSGYGLRIRSTAFAQAWDAAQQLAVGRLSAMAFDRAIHGRVEQVYHQGELVGERRVPSERLLMWLLTRLDPKRFAAPWERRKDDVADPQAEAQTAFPMLLNALVDTPVDFPPPDE